MAYEGYQGYDSAPSSTAAMRRAMALKQLQAGMDTSPIRSGWQGAARMADALFGGLEMRDITQKEEASRQAFANAMGGGAQPSSASSAMTISPDAANSGASADPVPPMPISQTGAPAANDVGTGRPDPQAMMAYAASKGAAPNEIRLLVPAGISESSLNPAAIHDGGIGYGLFGHNGDRLKAMKEFTGTDTPNWQQQTDFALHEIRHSNIAKMLDQAKTPQDIANAQMFYERPRGFTPSNPTAGDNYANRLKTVQKYWNVPTGQNGNGQGPAQPAPQGVQVASADPSFVPQMPPSSGQVPPEQIDPLAPLPNSGGPAPSRAPGASLAAALMGQQGGAPPAPEPQQGGNGPALAAALQGQGQPQGGAGQPMHPGGPNPAVQASPAGLMGSPPGTLSPQAQKLLAVAMDPYSDPATRQMATQMIQTQMVPQIDFITRPDGSVISVDKRTGRPVGVVAQPMKTPSFREVEDPQTGIKRTIQYDPVSGQAIGEMTPQGLMPFQNGQAPAQAANPQAQSAIPQGVDPKRYREERGSIAARESMPSAKDELDFAHTISERPSYKEYAGALPTWNAFTQQIAENTPSSDKAAVDAFVKIMNPGRAVTTGSFLLNSDVQGLPDLIRQDMLKAFNGDSHLSPDAKAQMARIAEMKMGELHSAWQTDSQQATKIAQAHGHSIERVIPSFPDRRAIDYDHINSAKTTALEGAGTPNPQPQSQNTTKSGIKWSIQ